MNRSPLFYPLNRGGDGEAGGASDLQTDIMRFMAILSLCLVAIFALVQSIPLTPGELPTPTPTPATPAPEPAPAPTPEMKPDRTRTPTVETPTRRAPVPVQARGAPKAPPTQGSRPPVATSAPADEGFTLRFESDAALTQLVARSDVGLYAIAPERSLRLGINGGTYAFWPASTPNRYHEMDAGTVPDVVITALRRAGESGSIQSVKWGVTLPLDMRRKLDGYLTNHVSGALVIESSGELRLEP